MGSGKSKTAEALSKLLKYQSFDLDVLISQQVGKSISTIFAESGEDYFRLLEKEALHKTAEVSSSVIATGGGTPCFFDNMDWMNQHGITIYLQANAGLLFHRLSASKQGRPLIENLGDIELMEQISGHLAVRSKYYTQSMITMNAVSLNVKILAEEIISFVKSKSS